jgi:hypothetical protein
VSGEFWLIWNRDTALGSSFYLHKPKGGRKENNRSLNRTEAESEDDSDEDYTKKQNKFSTIGS